MVDHLVKVMSEATGVSGTPHARDVRLPLPALDVIASMPDWQRADVILMRRILQILLLACMDPSSRSGIFLPLIDGAFLSRASN